MSNWNELGPTTEDEGTFTRAEILAARSQPPLTIAPPTTMRTRPNGRRHADCTHQPEAAHGTRSRYQAPHRCRCPRCVDAQRAYDRARWHLRRSA